MAKCFVQVSASVALVYVNGKCWVLQKDNSYQPWECRAPQMHNVHMNSFFEEMYMEEEYPFLKIKDILQKKGCQNFMRFCACNCMDKEMPLQLRKKSADLLDRYSFEGYSLSAFEWLSETLLNAELPAEADINKEIFDCLPQKFQELFRQIFKKYRNIDI